MATILRLPNFNLKKGVLTLTSAERDQLVFGKNSAKFIDLITMLKSKWIVGIHHNWHDFEFSYNPLFDFHLAGEEDLKEKNGFNFPLIPMDACNFVPDFFKPSDGEKFWDILYVARGVFFKKIPEFFKIIRSLYDKGYKYRVLLLSPVNPISKDLETEFSPASLRDLYEKIFSEEEQDLFTLMSMDFRYPFPLDLKSVAFFYRSARIFVHSANDERRSRVVSYALASELPVVALDCVASLLPKSMIKPPTFYLAKNYEDFPNLIVKALTEKEKITVNSSARNLFINTESQKRIKVFLASLDNEHVHDNSRYFLSDLDIRLGRHHGLSSGKNKISIELFDFLTFLNNPQRLNRIFDSLNSAADPELILAKTIKM